MGDPDIGAGAIILGSCAHAGYHALQCMQEESSYDKIDFRHFEVRDQSFQLDYMTDVSYNIGILELRNQEFKK